MHTALYIIWFTLPTIFFFLALWSKLEQIGGHHKRDNPSDLFHQGLFILVCVFVCVVVDQTILADLVLSTVGDSVPLGFFQAFLLPLMLLLGAKVVGPSRKILISGKDARSPRAPKRRR